MNESNSGFTLIELLIVVVIIGILAAIAIPKYGAVKGQAQVASMKTDLRNLASSMEGYFSDNTTYTTDKTKVNVQESAGVTVTITQATGSDWAATAKHLSTSSTCGIFAGAGAKAKGAPATQQGEVLCS